MDEDKAMESQKRALEALAKCREHKMQKTTEGSVMAGKDRLIDGKFEKELLERSEVNREGLLMSRTSLKPEERFIQAHQIVMLVLKNNRSKKMTAEDIQRETKGKSEMVEHFKRNGIDIREEREPTGKDGNPPRTLEQLLKDTYERQSNEAATVGKEQMERLIYDERTSTFRWKGVYSDIQCKEDILSNLEDIDDLASHGDSTSIGIETRNLRSCYPGAREDVLEMINTKQVYCISRKPKKEMTEAEFLALSEERRKEELERREEELLENGVIYWKDTRLAGDVDCVDDSLRELWKVVVDEYSKQQDLLAKFRKAPKLQSKLIQTVADCAVGNSRYGGDSKGNKREGRERTRIMNTHMHNPEPGPDFSKPFFDFSKPFDRVEYEKRQQEAREIRQKKSEAQKALKSQVSSRSPQAPDPVSQRASSRDASPPVSPRSPIQNQSQFHFSPQP
mmetsp:Transcript_110033/g.190604  ORF Transcript_110033/g.190604 Transcript_110033/m.190604 type:complete len:450 (-) Transcript_110033:2754-4103(-)